MGKDKKKKKDKTEHKARIQDKTERKTAKKVKKQKSKKEEEEEPEEDIETILARFKNEQEEKYKVTEEIVGGPPSRRANATFTANPTNPNELILFGGEFYDGQRVHMYNDLYRYNIEKDEWKRITSPNSPGPRSSHQVVIMPTGILFLFGGEFVSPNETQFFHYKDFWAFDLKLNQWEKLDVKLKPSARSGHRMALWKHFIVLFGGFYDNYVQTNYYDDLWFFNTLDYKWTKAEMSESMMKPSARSGFCFIPTNDGIILHGGYCKQYVKGQRAKGIVHSDTWLLRMNTEIKLIKWEKRKKSGFAPSPRSGASMAIFKNRAVLFGGVYDEDVSEEKLESTFYNELYTYQIDSGRWFPLNLKKPKKPKKQKQSQQQRRGAESDSDIESDRNSSDEDATHKPGASKPIPAPTPQLDNEPDLPQPCARYNTMMCVQRSTLYIYGGILEAQEKEYTLDDFWTLNMDKMTEYVCLKASEIDAQVWLGEESGDDDEDEEDGEEDDEDEESGEDDEDMIEEEEAEEVLEDEMEEDREEDRDIKKTEEKASKKEKEKELKVKTKKKEKETGQWQSNEGVDEKNERDENPRHIQESVGKNMQGKADKKEKEKDRRQNDGKAEEKNGDKDSRQLQDVDVGTKKKTKKKSTDIGNVEIQLAKVNPTPPDMFAGVSRRGQDTRINEEEVLNTPKPGETLRDFYARTTTYWSQKMYEQEGTVHGKALRRDAFQLAQDRYNEYQPILAEIEKLRIAAGLDEDDQVGKDGKKGGAAGGLDKMASRNRR